MRNYHGRFMFDRDGDNVEGTIGLQIEGNMYYFPMSMSRDALERAIGAIVVAFILSEERRAATGLSKRVLKSGLPRPDEKPPK